MTEPSDYQRNAEFGYQLAADLYRRAARETDALHQRRLLRDADTNLGWAQINDALESARQAVDAIELPDDNAADHHRDSPSDGADQDTNQDTDGDDR